MSRSEKFSEYIGCQEMNIRRPRDTAHRLMRQLQTLPVSMHLEHLNYYFSNSVSNPRDVKNTSAMSRLHSVAQSRPLLSSSSTLPQPSLESVVKIEKNVIDTAESEKNVNGLTGHDVLIIASDAASSYHSNAAMYYCLQLTAIHALKNGTVIHCSAPGGKSIDRTQLIEIIEKQLLHCNEQERLVCNIRQERLKRNREISQEQSNVRSSGVIEEYEAQIISALEHVRIITCEDLTDLELFCNMFALQESKFAKNVYEEKKCDSEDVRKENTNNKEVTHKTLSRNDLRGKVTEESIVPLVFVHDAAGKNSYLYQYERSVGQEIPIMHWLLTSLQRRIHCALVLTESLSCSIDEDNNTQFVHCVHSSAAVEHSEHSNAPSSLSSSPLLASLCERATFEPTKNACNSSTVHDTFLKKGKYNYNKQSNDAHDEVTRQSDYALRLQSLLLSRSSTSSSLLQKREDKYKFYSPNTLYTGNDVNYRRRTRVLTKTRYVHKSVADRIAEEKLNKIICKPVTSLLCSRTSVPNNTDINDVKQGDFSTSSMRSDESNMIHKSDLYMNERCCSSQNVSIPEVDIHSLRIHCLCITLRSSRAEHFLENREHQLLNKWFVNGHLFKWHLTDNVKLNDLRDVNVSRDNSRRSRYWAQRGRQERKVVGEYLCTTQLLEHTHSKNKK